MLTKYQLYLYGFFGQAANMTLNSTMKGFKPQTYLNYKHRGIPSIAFGD